MLRFTDFYAGMPVFIDGHSADITNVTADMLYAEGRTAISPVDSRVVAWTIRADRIDMVVYDGDRDFIETGTVLCDDCGRRVRPQTLASLPPHGCTERQRVRAAETQEG